MTPAKFRTLVWDYYRREGRHSLPWRKTKDPYKILVSEVMLQQTQVERVRPFYKKFIQKFPTPNKLAAVTLSEVLKAWQGLGYNRRAKMLHAAARVLAAKKMSTVAELEALPGVGPYTARAIAAFAWNQDVALVETNIRTAIIHHFFPRRSDVEDTELVEVLQEVLPKGRAGEWYSALMDYGAFLKRSGISHNARSAKYAKQSKFAGSLREVRGAILKELSRGSVAEARLLALLGIPRRAQMRAALTDLLEEELVKKRGAHGYALPD